MDKAAAAIFASLLPPRFRPENLTAATPLTERERIMLAALKHLHHWHDQLGKRDIAMLEAAIKLAEGEP